MTDPFAPGSLAAARGWDGVGRALARCVELERSGRLPGSLLLVGEQAQGREALAVELAAAAVCRLRAPAGCPCPSCGRVRRGVHPDVRLVVPEKDLIAIETVREVVDSLPQRPFEGLRRVVVIASVHTPPLGVEAASALLKAVEEPPPHVLLVLLAGNPRRVLPTIVSRTVQVRVPPPERPGPAADWLELSRSAAGEGGGDPATVHARVAAPLAGDGLALVELAGVTGGTEEGAELSVASLLAVAEGGAGDPERALIAAATLLRAARRRAALKLDWDGVYAQALAGP